MSIPQLIAHRGDAQRHPENSLAAFSSALAAGVRHVECDLQINASGTLVVLHDADLRRTHECDLSVFERIDGQPPQLPTVGDVLDLAAGHPDATFYFEIKHDSIDHWGADHVLATLQPLLVSIGHHVLLASSADFLQQVRQAGFESIGVILREWTDAARGQLAALAPDLAITNIRRVADGERLWPGSWKWAVYEIPDLATARTWGDRGADFAISYNAVELISQREGQAR